MIIKNEDTKLPESVEPSTCRLAVFSEDPEKDPGAIMILVQQISFNEMVNLRSHNSDAGLPRLFAIGGVRNEILCVYPKPDRPHYYAELTFCSARKQL